MRTKHWSLDARTNMRLAAVWLAICAAITLLFPSLRLLVALAMGGIGGVAFGILQDRAIRASPRAFCEAETALAVRRAAAAVCPNANRSFAGGTSRVFFALPLRSAWYFCSTGCPKPCMGLTERMVRTVSGVTSNRPLERPGFAGRSTPLRYTD
jgi:hypothetical protein